MSRLAVVLKVMVLLLLLLLLLFLLYSAIYNLWLLGYYGAAQARPFKNRFYIVSIAALLTASVLAVLARRLSKAEKQSQALGFGAIVENTHPVKSKDTDEKVGHK